jgi:hypothetical protein
MTTAYRLHYAPDNASLIIRLTLEEMGLPYQAVLVDRHSRAQKGAPYLALNPHGRIPVLETPEGAIYETGAILLWLADRHRGDRAWRDIACPDVSGTGSPGPGQCPEMAVLSCPTPCMPNSGCCSTLTCTSGPDPVRITPPCARALRASLGNASGAA